MKKIINYLPHLLLGIYLVEFVVLAISPYDRATWWAENIPVFIAVSVLVVTFKKFRFSNTAYILMAVFLMFHTIGGHYTFERVPFDWFNDFVGSSRNNFDRVGHFLVGVFAYPVAEFFWRKQLVAKRWVAVLIGILALGAWGAVYEIIEAYYAVTQGGEQAANFLGSQGDIWDAQKDMFLDILGAIFTGVAFLLQSKFLTTKKTKQNAMDIYGQTKQLKITCQKCGAVQDSCANDTCSAITVCQKCGEIISNTQSTHAGKKVTCVEHGTCKTK